MGMNEVQRLQAAGVQAKKASVTRLPLRAVTIPKEGSVAHPRYTLPPHRPLIDYIKKHGVPGALSLREAGIVDDVMTFDLCNGSRRTKNGLIAEEELRAEAPRKAPLTFDRDDPSDLGVLYADVELFVGSDAEFLLERLSTNANREQLPDTVDVLAATVKQLKALKFEDVDAIVAVMPRGVGPKEVHALGRWDNLFPSVQARFIAGAPIGLLPAVCDAPRTEEAQHAVLDTMSAKGITNAAGATRVLNKERVEKAAAKGETVAKKISPKQAKKVTAALLPTPAERKEAFDAIDRLPRGAEHYERLYAEAFAAGMRYRSGEKVTGMPRRVLDAIAGVTGK